MRHIYIDLGCYDGDTVEQFLNWKSLAYDPDIPWDIYAFDPIDRFIAKWRKMETERIKFERKAAWIFDGEIEYTQRPPEAPFGSTIMKEKRDWGMGEVSSVPCFDFSAWLKQFRDDHVIVKMDTEGSEYPLLKKMIEDETDDIPARLMIEWHGGRMPGYQTDAEEIQSKLRCKWFNWR